MMTPEFLKDVAAALGGINRKHAQYDAVLQVIDNFMEEVADNMERDDVVGEPAQLDRGRFVGLREVKRRLEYFRQGMVGPPGESPGSTEPKST